MPRRNAAAAVAMPATPEPKRKCTIADKVPESEFEDVVWTSDDDDVVITKVVPRPQLSRSESVPLYVAPPRRRTVTLSTLYADMCAKLGVSHGTTLNARDVSKILRDDYFGGYTIAEPRTAPVKLHAAYPRNTLTVLVVGKDCKAVNMRDEDTFNQGAYLSMPKDAATQQETRPDKYVKAILDDTFPAHLTAFLVAIDRAISLYHTLEMAESLYKGSTCPVPTPADLEVEWTKATEKGKAPARHFIHKYEATDKDGNTTDRFNYSLDAGVVNNSGRLAKKSKSGRVIPLPSETKVKIYGRGSGGGLEIVNAADHDKMYIQQQEKLEKGMRTVLAISFRGINHLPEKMTVGPNVKCDVIYALEREDGSAAPDLSVVVEE